MISKLRYILFIIIFAIAIYYYIYNRTAGCKNKEAINFNPEADIGDDMKCIYNTLGCLDKNAGNYNKFATVSCTEDCLGCEEKGTCDLCNNHRECKNECTDCICKPKVKGCNRTWALNYDPNATNDNGSCMSKEDFLKKISIISGGDCKRCSGRVNIKLGDKYPILGGKQGINVLVMERNDKLNIRYNKSFMTGNYELENKKFVDFMRKYVHYNDIVIITIRGDAVGTKRSLNSKNEPVFMESILSDDSKMVLQYLGAKSPEIAREGSYILIGTYLNDIYFETYSSNADSYFPYFNLTNYGCVNFNNPKYEKIELDLNKLKLLQATGDVDEASINNDKSDDPNMYKNATKENFVDMNKVDNINRCALEVIQMGYKIFSISKTKCFVYKLKEEFKNDPNEDIVKYFKLNKFINYTEDNKYFRLSDNICRLNTQLLPYGNEKEESLYLIDEVYHSGLFSMMYGGQMVEIYNLGEQRGMRREVGVGIHEAWGTIPKSVNSKQDMIYIPITSMNIPHDFKVTLYRNVYKNEDLTKFINYELKFDKDYKNMSKLDISCCEGAKITTKNTSTKKIIRDLEYRIWKNIVKNLSIKRSETIAKLYIYDENIEQVSKRPEINNKYVLQKTFDLSTYIEIDKLKEYNGHGKVGYIELFTFNGSSSRRIDFSTWEFFWNLYFIDILKPWIAYYTRNDGIYPEEGIFTIMVVDPAKKLLRKTCTLYGYNTGDKEEVNGVTHKKCDNIPKYGDCENNDSKLNPFTSDIKYLIVSKQNFGVTIYEEPEFQGASITLGYGKYNLPDDLCMIIQSMKVDFKYAVVRLYLDFNFKNEFIRLIHNSTKSIGSKFSYTDINNLIPLNRKIRSISIEKVDYYTNISNNPYPDEYDNNKIYDSYQYPYKYKLSNDRINYMDYCYDYFKDEIMLDSNDKFVRFIKEDYEYTKLKNISGIGGLYEINSAGGITYLKNKLGTNFNKLLSGIKTLKTYDENNNFIRKFIILDGKIMDYNGSIVKFISLETLNFDKSERVVKLCETDRDEILLFNNHNNVFNEINNAIRQNGKYLAIKNNNEFIRINYDELDLKSIITKRVNLILTNNNDDIVLKENISNTESTEDYNLYVIKKPAPSDQVPIMCVCEIMEDEYNPNNFLYSELNRYNFNIIIASVSLAQKKSTLKELGIIENNNYEKLNNLNSKVYNSPAIVQILDNKFNINKTIYFNCHKYVINNNINILNKLEKVDNNNELYISKHEKNVEILMRNNVNYNDKFEDTFTQKFNLRQDLNSALETNIQSNLNLINNQIKDSGLLETYDINSKLIRKRIYNEGNIEEFGKVDNISEITFGSDEKILILYDKNRKRIVNLPIILKANANSINSALRGLLFNNNCFIKFYDINKKLIRVGLSKENKFIFKNNDKYLSMNYKEYVGKFDKFNWLNADMSYSINLDEIFMSIELENGAEIMYTSINVGNTFTNIDDLLKSFGYNNNLKDHIFRFLLKTKLYSIIRFYDFDNKVTKKLKFSFQPIIDRMFGSVQERFPILLYDSPIQYMETYKNNVIYNCYQKDDLIISIYIPNAMKGIYSYKVDGKVVYVDKVLSDDGITVKLYDEDDKLIIDSDDKNLHNYLLGIKIDKYNGKIKLEYYPKINKTVIRLLDKTNNIDKIETSDYDEIKDIEINDQLGNTIRKIKKRNIYILENNISSLKIINPDNSYSIKYTESIGVF